MGPGWYQHKNPYGAPIVRAQLEVETQDGPSVIATDGEWRTAESCITQLGSWSWNNFGGERYDAGKYVSNWNLASCEDRSWAKAIEVAAPNLTTSWQALPGNQMDPPIPATGITPFKGKWLIDFGTTLTGWMRLRMDGLKPGQEIVLDYADTLDPKLMFSRNEDGVQTHNQCDIYVAGSEPTGVFQSKFNQHGFRYVVVRGLDQVPDLSDAQAMMVRTHLEPAGEFRCSNELFNRIHEITVHTFLTQAPAGALGGGEPREKEAYGDGGSFLTGWIYNLGCDAFFMKWLQDWRDNQRKDGFFGNTAPSISIHGGGPSWGGQASELMRRLILYCGDRASVRDYYPALRKYVDYLESHTENDILRRFNPKDPRNPKLPDQWQFLGDWTPPGASADKHNFEFESTDQQEFFNNCYRILLWQDLADFAGTMGDTTEQKRCQERLAVLRPLIHQAYFDAEKKNYRVNRQAYLVIALRARIMPAELRPVIFKQLEDDIVVAKKGHLDVGLQGSFMLLDLLVQENRADLAALIMGQETYPGWGFLVKERKVTTWPETWSGWGSQIIQVVGTPGAWFYEGLAGIRPDPAQPGFKHFLIRPGIVDSVDWVTCWHDSPYGRIVSNWKREGDKLTMDVTVPANSTATVYVQTKEASAVTESGKPIDQADGVKCLRMEINAAVYAVGSGTYQFRSHL
jgi:alpha-L-rhamnosidase